MKRTLKFLGIFLSAIFLLAACSSDDNDDNNSANLYAIIDYDFQFE